MSHESAGDGSGKGWAQPAPRSTDAAAGASGAASPDAVILLGHGSRARGASDLLEWVAAGLRGRLDCTVATASLQFNEPTLEQSCRRLAEAGAHRIVVAPYFLFQGNHMKIDIPGELQELERQLPGVSLRLAAPLGADMRLVEVVRARVLEAGGPFAADAREASGFADPACASSCDGGAAAEHAGISAASGDTSALAPHPIESESFAIIDALLGVSDEDDPEYQITRRVIHATGDPSLAASLSFSPRAVAAGVEALLAGSNIICDVNMVAAGLCPSAAKLGREAVCGIAEAATETLAHSAGITRAAAALRRVAANDRLAGAIVAVGNAPTALFECLRLASMEGIRPALVIGVPVGFVGAAESKQALQQSGLEYIALPGNRGGSSIAVAIAGALLRLAAAGAE